MQNHDIASVPLDQVTNDQFVQVLFGESRYDALALSVSDVSDRSQWQARYYKDMRPLDPDVSNFYCISTFSGDQRRDEYFDATHVFVVDDVVEKIDPVHLRRATVPTYRLLTSAGSEQWGWKLNPPETDMQRVKALQSAS